MKNTKLLIGISIGIILFTSVAGIIYLSNPDEPIESINVRHYNVNVTDNFIVGEKKESIP
jgi:hypothetical protein